jgi:copper chaperone CopZ
MKTALLSLFAVSAMLLSVRAADVTVKLTDVHLCCQSCVKGVSAALTDVKGVTATADQDENTVTLVAADKATVQKAVDALVKAGFYGKTTDADIKIVNETGAKNQKVQSLTVEGVHLCCGKCVKAVNTLLGSVNGVKANTAAKGVKSFTVTGDFNDKDVFDALEKAGLAGHVAPAQ